MKIHYTRIFLLLFVSFTAFSQPFQVGDLTGNETYFTGFNGSLYFASGNHIKVSDTTSKSIDFFFDMGEPVISDRGYASHIEISPVLSPLPDFPRFPTTSQYIFFLSKPEPDSTSLWISDGTVLGTQKLGVFDGIYTYTVFQDELYFVAGKAGYGRELWRVYNNDTIIPITDKDFQSVVVLEAGTDYLYFSSTYELFRTAGTISSTIQVTELNGISYGNLNLSFLDGRLFFNTNRYVYVYDNINVAMIDSVDFLYYIGSMAIVDNLLLYEVYIDATAETKLYVTNGSPFASQLIYYESSNYLYGYWPVKNNLFFYTPDDYLSIANLNKTDGTVAGTVDFTPNTMRYRIADRFGVVGDYLFFPTSEDEYPDFTEGTFELTQSDLTMSGTVKVKDLFGGGKSYNLASNFTDVNSVLFFSRGDTNSVFASTLVPPALLYFYKPVQPVITAVKTKQDIVDMSIFPNPTKSNCWVQADLVGNLYVTDVFGNEIIKEKFDNKISLDLSQLKSGVYIVKLLGENNQTMVQKFIKQ
jgi:hypothetical protein